MAIVSPSLAVLAVNWPMAKLLATRDGLAEIDGHLVAQRDTDHLRTAAALHGSPQLLQIDRSTSAGPPYVVAVCPLATGKRRPEPCLIRVIDLLQPLAIAPETLARLYALTPAQAEIAIAIAEGKSLEAIVTERHIVIGTLRRHLHALFRKTGTHTQGGLIRLILSLDRLVRI